ncbi:MAG: hypothetical protein ACW967_05985 [Candidatus Hodarchaeales archaeon]|jgi:heme/copper-type cytochrome/quinol oxidase subunit 2
MPPRITIIVFVIFFFLGSGFGTFFSNGFHNSSSNSFDPFDYLRTHTSTSNALSDFPIVIPFVIILFIFVVAWIIVNRRKKEQ